MQNQNLFLGIIIAGVLIIAGGIFFMFWGADNAVEEQEQVPVTSGDTVEEGSAVHDVDSELLMRIGDNAIFVPEQLPGKIIKASLVAIKEGGYIVIHEVKNENVGAIVGSSAYIPPGQYNALTIALSKDMQEGEKYVAMLHSDDGDTKFDAAKDKPLPDVSGETLMILFDVSKNANPDAPVSF